MVLSPHANSAPHIVIIGGGITGLSAAYHLTQRAAADGELLECTLIERDMQPGGKIRTERIEADGAFLVEGGPDSFVGQKPWAIDLARELGIDDQLIDANPVKRSTYLLWRGKPQPLPEGMMMVVPTRMAPFALSPLLSPLGKLRMALDLIIPPRRDSADESLASFIRRRLGREALERLAEPLMAGIHSADAERQSLLATFPRFHDLEQRHGSLIRGMLAARRARRPAADSSRFAASPFVTFRTGMGSLVDALVVQTPARMLFGAGVAALTYDSTAARAYRLRLDDGRQIDADAVIVATPPAAAAKLLAPTWPDPAQGLAAIRSVSTATISLAFRRSDVRRPLDGYGMVIPRGEGRAINAITMTSTKFAGRAPEDATLIRVFAGGSRNPAAFEHDDERLLALAHAELRSILGVDAEPLFTRIYRWPQGNPQYDVGHLERIDRLFAACPPGLALAGGAYRGVGIPDCIREGRAAAERALAECRGVTSAD
jgi:oxygen-dependent protoporphyrinogen oxidase